MVRIYDKHGPVRVELQLRSERAELAVLELMACSSEDEVELRARGLLIDYLEFVDRDSDSNMGRRKRLPWWASFVEGVARVRHLIPRAAKSLDRCVGWIQQKVAPSIAMAMAYAGEQGQSLTDWALGMFEAGSKRWTAWQAASVESLSLVGSRESYA
jgi:hypothetical protein